MPRTYSELYIAVRNRLREAGIEAAELEGKLITATAAGKTTEKLLRDMRFYATDEVEKRAESMLKRRLAGEPVAYITGVWEFRGLPMEVSPAVLIPRVDTEVLAETAINWLHGRKMDARAVRQDHEKARPADDVEHALHDRQRGLHERAVGLAYGAEHSFVHAAAQSAVRVHAGLAALLPALGHSGLHGAVQPALVYV